MDPQLIAICIACLTDHGPLAQRLFDNLVQVLGGEQQAVNLLVDTGLALVDQVPAISAEQCADLVHTLYVGPSV